MFLLDINCLITLSMLMISHYYVPLFSECAGFFLYANVMQKNLISAFNELKSKCMYFSKRQKINLGSLFVNERQLEFVIEYKYLGVYIRNDLNDNAEISFQTRKLYASSNILLRKFNRCSIHVKLILFQCYCMCFYLLQLCFQFNLGTMNRLRVAFNNSLRRILGLPRYCSATEMCVFNRIDSFECRLRKLRVNFYIRLCRSSNYFISNYLKSDCWKNSRLNSLIVEYYYDNTI